MTPIGTLPYNSHIEFSNLIVKDHPNGSLAMAFDPQEVSAPGAKIKVIGVGGGGTNAVSTMIRSNIEGVEFIAANTDVQSLRFALAPKKLQIGKELTKGLGAGADPDIGRDAALEDRHELQETLVGSDMVFVTAGMGGGTGTGGASIVSQIARENGALTVGVVTKPFAFEGKRRKKHAEIGIAKLKEQVDTLVVIPNDRLLKIATPDLSMLEAFKMADTVLVNAVRGISDIINVPGTINVDFADVKTVMSCMGQALMGIGIARGENRAKEAALKAISSPLLEDVDIEGATGILINISAGEKISLIEINEACSIIEEAAHEDANIIFGAVIDEDMSDDIRITVIATGFPTTEEEDYVVPAQNSRSSFKNRSFGASKNVPQNPSPRPPSPVSTFTKGSIDTSDTSPSSEPPSSPSISETWDSQNPDEPFTKDFSSISDENDLNLKTINPDPFGFSKEDSVSSEANDKDSEPRVETSTPEGSFEDSMRDEPNVDLDFYPSALNQERKTFTPSNEVSTPTTFAARNSQNDSNFESFDSLTQNNQNTSGVESDNFFTKDRSDFANDIDKRIDEALELAEKVRSLDRKEDDLDIPSFLRNTGKNFDLS